jgi:hypothetical protein
VGVRVNFCKGDEVGLSEPDGERGEEGSDRSAWRTPVRRDCTLQVKVTVNVLCLAKVGAESA